MLKKNNPKKKLCGVKFEIQTAMNKINRETIDKFSKKYDCKRIILPKNEETFIVVFDSLIKREGFMIEITPHLFGEVAYSYVSNIEE